MPVSPQYHPDPRHPLLGEAFFDPVTAAAFPQAVLRFRNQRWAERIGLGELTEEEWIGHFARFQPLPDNLPGPLALRYHGHQFMSYNPELGDGRGFLFAQLRDPVDERLLDLATKGSGQTPWSRRGDGRLTLKGGVREVLATEMLEALGCYTSKSFSLIETGEKLQRHDEPSPTRSSVLVRLGHSHIRFGTFQRQAARSDGKALRALIDYSIETYWPEAGLSPDPAAALLDHVVSAMAEQAAEWFAAGFVHGVLNTDNMVITGESFDYGPWRFLPVLDPRFTAAYFDETGLYAFGRQPAQLLWNLERLAECLLFLSSQEALETVLGYYAPRLDRALTWRVAERLGLDPEQVMPQVLGLFYAGLRDSRIGYERAYFDLIGGARPERLAASPHADVYASETFAPLIALLRDAAPHPALERALGHRYFTGAAPCTMLIDEVEALWAPIAAGDDWSAFAAKLEAIRAMGEAYAPLMRPRALHVPIGA